MEAGGAELATGATPATGAFVALSLVRRSTGLTAAAAAAAAAAGALFRPPSARSSVSSGVGSRGNGGPERQEEGAGRREVRWGGGGTGLGRTTKNTPK